MKSFILSTTLFLWLLTSDQLNAQQARRTAPRRTTVNGGTYGTETYATVTAASTVALKPEVTAATVPVPVFQPLNAPPSFGGAGGGAPVVMGVPPVAQGVVALLPGAAISVTPRTRVTGVTIPTRVMPTMPPRQEDGIDVPGEGDASKSHTPVVSLCEEVEEVLKPGTTQEECYIGEPVTLRYWQPYRALRTIKCKNGNSTEPGVASKDQCPAVYPGATCVQKYQQFVVLAAMGPASSGWSCVRLGSGCSCSVRNRKRLRITDYEQRSDLREFMKTA